MVDPLQREQQKLKLLEEQELKKRNALQAQRDLIAQLQLASQAYNQANAQHFAFNQVNDGQQQEEEEKTHEIPIRGFGRDIGNSVSPNNRVIDSTTQLVKQRNQKRKERAALAKNNGLPNMITNADEDDENQMEGII